MRCCTYLRLGDPDRDACHLSRLIIDAVVVSTTGRHPLPQHFWWIVSLEFALAATASILSRTIGFFEKSFRRSFHALYQCPRDGTRVDAGFGILRESGVLRQAGAGADFRRLIASCNGSRRPKIGGPAGGHGGIAFSRRVQSTHRGCCSCWLPAWCVCCFSVRLISRSLATR